MTERQTSIVGKDLVELCVDDGIVDTENDKKARESMEQYERMLDELRSHTFGAVSDIAI